MSLACNQASFRREHIHERMRGGVQIGWEGDRRLISPVRDIRPGYSQDRRIKKRGGGGGGWGGGAEAFRRLGLGLSKLADDSRELGPEINLVQQPPSGRRVLTRTTRVIARAAAARRGGDVAVLVPFLCCSRMSRGKIPFCTHGQGPMRTQYAKPSRV